MAIKAKNLPLNNALKDYNSKNYIPLHMPGHEKIVVNKHYSKYQKIILNKLKSFQNKIYSYDLTEVEDLDNLQSPSSCIKKSEEIIAEYFNAKSCYFSVQGSSLGVLSMIRTACNIGDKIILPKASHKSCYNAISLFNLNPIFINQFVNKKFHIPDKIDLDDLKKKIKENPEAKAIFISSPDYYGTIQNIEEISKIAKDNNILLLADFAHGAHYKYMGLSTPLDLGADMMCQSIHKTLPALTPSALIFSSKNLDDKINDKLQKNISMLQTTSPSYVIMANIELVHNLMTELGEKILARQQILIENLKNRLSDEKMIHFYNSDDKLRLVVSIDEISGKDLDDSLRYNHNILAEMHSEKCAVFLINPLTTKLSINSLEAALKKILSENKEQNINNKEESKNSKQNNVETEENFTKNSQEFSQVIKILKDNMGEILDFNIYVYPPGTPIAKIGDKVDENLIELIKKYEEENIILG